MSALWHSLPFYAQFGLALVVLLIVCILAGYVIAACADAFDDSDI